MNPNSRGQSLSRHLFLYFCLLLAVQLVGTGGLTGYARPEAHRTGVGPALEMPRATRGKHFAVGLASAIVKDSRDFAGAYEEVNATDLGETYYVSIKFQIFNYSDGNVSDATVCQSDRLTNESIWSSAGVSIEDRQSVVLEGDLTIPRSEYEYWQQGGTPYLFIEYRNAQGEEARRTIELTRKPIAEVQ